MRAVPVSPSSSIGAPAPTRTSLDRSIPLVSRRIGVHGPRAGRPDGADSTTSDSPVRPASTSRFEPTRRSGPAVPPTPFHLPSRAERAVRTCSLGRRRSKIRYLARKGAWFDEFAEERWGGPRVGNVGGPRSNPGERQPEPPRRPLRAGSRATRDQQSNRTGSTIVTDIGDIFTRIV